MGHAQPQRHPPSLQMCGAPALKERPVDRRLSSVQTPPLSALLRVDARDPDIAL